MSKGLTSPQKSILVKAYRAGGNCHCTPIRGEALQRRGYGYYYVAQRLFVINNAGCAFARDGIQLEQ